MLQRLLNSKAFVSAAGAFLAGYVKFVNRTSNVSEDPPGFIAKYLPDHPLIIAMWHGQYLMIPFIRPKHIKVAIMVARHLDGDIAHEGVTRLGMTTVRGAGAGRKGKDKGGFDALRACMKALRSDTTVAATADMPPGPARKAGLGLVTLSKLSGRAILPIAVVTSRYIKLNTWSGLTVNLPFSKMVMACGEQIRLPRHATDSELEAARQKLEESLNETTARAYRLAGVSERGTPSETNPCGFGPALNTYVRATRLLQPFSRFLLRYRERHGKEESGRINERLGIPSAPRLPGPLLWLHAASVGETMAILGIIHRLKHEHPDLEILLTTGTVTSAKLAASRLPDGAVHQYIPLDTPDYISGFLDHWRPDAVILTESEIWPNLIQEARKREIPLILVNGRISPRSFKRWRKRYKIARPLFSSLDLVLAQNNRYADYFERLGSRNVVVAGNLKMDAPPPPTNGQALEELRQSFGKRPVFLAASTHKGEEEIIAKAHLEMKKKLPGLLTIIVPRHPERCDEICELLKQKELRHAVRSRREVLLDEHDVYVADTIGELGLFYSLAPVSFVGGSLVPHGGQNPVEAIAHDSIVLTGPNVHNFEEAYARLLENKGCIEVMSAQELTRHVLDLVKSKKKRQAINKRAHSALDEMRGALDVTIDALGAYLPVKNAKEKQRAS